MRSTINLILIVATAVTASARQEFRRDFNKSVALPAGRAFRIESQFGRISIHTQPKPELDIHAAIRCSANSLDDARRCAGQIQIVVEETAAGVYVRTDYPNHYLNRNHQ
jgi:hypothetical protein